MRSNNLTAGRKSFPMEHRRLRLYAITFLADLVILMASLRLVARLITHTPAQLAEAELMQATVPLFAIIALYGRAYSIKGLENLRYAVQRLLFALLVSALLFVFLLFYLRPTIGSIREPYFLGLLVAVTGMVAVRAILALYIDKIFDGRIQNRLIIDDGGPVVELEKALRIEVEPTLAVAAVADPAQLDTLGRSMRGMDRVIVSCPNDRREAWARILRAAGVHGEIMSETLNKLGVLDLIRENNVAFLVVSSGPLGLRSRLIKRVMDLSIGILALILLSPVMLIAALAIKIEDGGPVFFVQPRIGHGNRIFRMLKFRSMRVDQLDPKGNRSTARQDVRVTRVGRLIRATSVDELPQLFNVLLSEMSLVGPRPHALGSLASDKLFWEIDGEYWQRHALKPGMTGLAQVRGHRGATDTEEHLTNRLQSDLEYIRDWSPWLDLKILISTLRVLVPDRA